MAGGSRLCECGCGAEAVGRSAYASSGCRNRDWVKKHPRVLRVGVGKCVTREEVEEWTSGMPAEMQEEVMRAYDGKG